MKTQKLAHTFSIVARDPATGQLGAAVQSHWFSVGSLVIWLEAGVGAVATQAMVEVSHGPLGLELLRAGKPAGLALAGLLAADGERELRQVALVDAAGQAAAHTGSRCIAAAGHRTGEGFSVQANMMLKDTVWGAMAEAYLAAPGDLADRLLAALDAAQAEGGDIRGKQSAALKIVEGKPAGARWQGVLMDLRVDDAPEPLAELRRLAAIQRAYDWMNAGDVALAGCDTETALAAYRTAAGMAPEMLELPFWHAVTLADLGRTAEALPLFARIFAAEPLWLELLRRLPPVGLLREDPEMMRQIEAVCPNQPQS